MATFLEKYQSLVPMVQRIILARANRVNDVARIALDSNEPTVAGLEQHGKSDPAAYNEFISHTFIDLAAAYAEMRQIDEFTGGASSLYKRTITYLKDGITRLSDRLQKYQHIIRFGKGATDIIFDTFVDASSKELNRKFWVNKPAQDAEIDHEAEALVLPKAGEISRVRSKRRGNTIARFEVDRKLGTSLSYIVEDTRHDPSRAIDKDRESFWAEVVMSPESITVKPMWWNVIKRHVIVDYQKRVGAAWQNRQMRIGVLCPRLEDGTEALPVLGSKYAIDVIRSGDTDGVVDTDISSKIETRTTTDYYDQQHFDISGFASETYPANTVRNVKLSMSEDFTVTNPITDGAACKTHLMLQFKSYANRITIKPFSYGPMDLVAAYTLPGDNDAMAFSRGEARFILISPIELKEHTVIHFPRHQVKRLVLVFNQRNYVRNIYNIPRIQKHNVETWNRLAQAEAETSVDLFREDLSYEEKNNPNIAAFSRMNRSVSQRKVDEVTGWSLFLEYAKRMKDYLLQKSGLKKEEDAMSSILNAMSMILRDKGITLDTETLTLNDIEHMENDTISVSALEYMYGLYDMDLDDVYYGSSGYFITKPFRVTGRAVEFTLRWEGSFPEGTSLDVRLSYNHNDTEPVWRGPITSGSNVAVLWPDNDDMTPVVEKYPGGRGSAITLKQTAYVHPVARAEGVVVGATKINFNYSNPNRVFEPDPTEMLEGYTPTLKWTHDLDDGIPAGTFQAFRKDMEDWVSKDTRNMPYLILENGSAWKNGVTDDSSNLNYVVSILGSQDHRFYYRPITVTITDRGRTYGPNPYGEPYFIEQKNFVLRIPSVRLFASTVSGAIEYSELTGHEQPLVSIITGAGEERDISMSEFNFYVPTKPGGPLDQRIKRWG